MYGRVKYRFFPSRNIKNTGPCFFFLLIRAKMFLLGVWIGLLIENPPYLLATLLCRRRLGAVAVRTLAARDVGRVVGILWGRVAAPFLIADVLS
jgi:hypothetical protein